MFEFLNVYWIRPETAIMRTIDAILLESVQFTNPSIDIACGNGLFSFVAHGGKLDNNSDAFQLNIKNGFHENKDIYNQEWKIKPMIKKTSNHIFDVGVDHKEKLLSNASLLQNYKRTLHHDMSKTFPLKEKFDTIFSNSLYWMPDIDFVLTEIQKICSGKVILFCPDEKFKREQKPYLWWKYLDRGISQNVKHYYSFEQWKKIFKQNGFDISKHVSYLTPELAEFFRYGTRLYSPYMIESMNRDIKKKVVSDMIPFVESWIDYEVANFDKNGMFHFFVLENNIR